MGRHIPNHWCVFVVFIDKCQLVEPSANNGKMEMHCFNLDDTLLLSLDLIWMKCCCFYLWEAVLMRKQATVNGLPNVHNAGMAQRLATNEPHLRTHG
jgi:hypothetical protein